MDGCLICWIMELTDLRYMVLYASDILSISSFYQEALALGKPVREERGHVGFQLTGLYLGFEKSDEPVQRGNLGFTPWFTVGDLFEVYGRCKMLGAKVRMEPERKERGVIVAALTDPMGNLFGLHQNGT